MDPRAPWTDRTSDSAVRWGRPPRRPRGSAAGRRCRPGSWCTSFKASEQPAGSRLDVPQITDPVASVFLYVHRASPRRSGHVRADSGDAQDNRLSNVRNLVTCSECWRDVRGGCAGCQRGELERLQKEVGGWIEAGQVGHPQRPAAQVQRAAAGISEALPGVAGEVEAGTPFRRPFVLRPRVPRRFTLPGGAALRGAAIRSVAPPVCSDLLVPSPPRRSLTCRGLAARMPTDGKGA